MKIKLHGTRGAYPTTSPNNRTYGGNTSCIEVINGKERIILDAGTGILEIDFDKFYKSDRIDILLTHLHMDHIQGLAFCKPLFNPNKIVYIWGPSGSRESLQSKLNRFLSPPLFPIALREIPCKLSIQELPNTPFNIGNFTINAEYISHPGPTVGFRIQGGEKTVTYIPDHEPVIGKPHLYPEDEWVSGFNLAKQSDLLIHDSQYSKDEYKNKVGWGHSSLEIASEFCSRTGSKHLLLFHHDPSISDAERTQIFEDFLEKVNYNFPIELAVQGDEIEV
ncbi:Ribonuclease BN, tRNA processing enzyme [Flavobacteriaceae bacterium MAR_2010_188]|nr:Ribonuclease BN, tRNA processing enzyme [Flavobacteriaceae bacterium MAR_2010_188]